MTNAEKIELLELIKTLVDRAEVLDLSVYGVEFGNRFSVVLDEELENSYELRKEMKKNG